MEIIKVATNAQGNQVVSARELHQYLEVTERFSNWFDRQIQYGFIENQDFTGCKVFNTLAKQELQDYALILDCAKEISMIQRSDKGKKARQYFIECERKLNESLLSQIPKTFSQALYLAAKAQEVIEQQQKLLEEQAPNVKAFKNVVDNSGYYTVDSLSDTVDIGRTKLYKILRDWKWVMKNSKNGTQSTRYCEEQRYGKTIFETIVINKKEINKKRFVLSRKGFELAINKLI
jgi:anti-repressor protein